MIPTIPEPTPDRRTLRERVSIPSIRLSHDIAQGRRDAAFLRRLADRLDRDEDILRRLS